MMNARYVRPSAARSTSSGAAGESRRTSSVTDMLEMTCSTGISVSPSACLTATLLTRPSSCEILTASAFIRTHPPASVTARSKRCHIIPGPSTG